MTTRVVIGTRRSLLAMAQTQWVASEIRRIDPSVEVVLEPMTTRGDRDSTVPLPAIGTKGLFTADLEEALLERRIDLAVHSAKDLPTLMREELHLAAIPPREDPRDALVSRAAGRIADLPQGALLGTSSTRRCAQLRRLRNDLRFTTLRGNVDTRIRKVRQGECDATLLAMAGLKRAGLAHEAAMVLEPGVMVPAPGQGALGLQCRRDDEATNDLLQRLNDPDSAGALFCERKVMSDLEGGCQTPIGVLVRRTGPEWRCDAVVASPDGTRCARIAIAGDLEDLAGRTVARLVDQGAREIIASCRRNE